MVLNSNTYCIYINILMPVLEQEQEECIFYFEQSDQAVEVTLHKTQYSLFPDTSV